MPEESKGISTAHIALIILLVLVLIVGAFEYLYLRAGGESIGFEDVRSLVLQERTQEAAVFSGSCPVGERLVFSASKTGIQNESDIYIACLTNGSLFNITNDQNGNFVPQLSESGSRIYYYAPRDDNPDFNDWEIWTSDLSGTNKQRLSENVRADTFPALSPDGEKIAFSSNETGTWQLHVMNVDGSNEIIVPSAGVFNATFSSPMTILFSQFNEEKRQDLFEYNLSDETVTRITDTELEESSPAVSPDGKLILFGSNATGNYEVYKMDRTGENVVRLTDTTADSGTAVFSHDGNKIIFVSDRSGNSEIYSMTLNGTNQQLLISGLNLFNVRNPAFAIPGN